MITFDQQTIFHLNLFQIANRYLKRLLVALSISIFPLLLAWQPLITSSFMILFLASMLLKKGLKRLNIKLLIQFFDQKIIEYIIRVITNILIFLGLGLAVTLLQKQLLKKNYELNKNIDILIKRLNTLFIKRQVKSPHLNKLREDYDHFKVSFKIALLMVEEIRPQRNQLEQEIEIRKKYELCFAKLNFLMPRLMKIQEECFWNIVNFVDFENNPDHNKNINLVNQTFSKNKLLIKAADLKK